MKVCNIYTSAPVRVKVGDKLLTNVHLGLNRYLLIKRLFYSIQIPWTTAMNHGQNLSRINEKKYPHNKKIEKKIPQEKHTYPRKNTEFEKKTTPGKTHLTPGKTHVWQKNTLCWDYPSKNIISIFTPDFTSNPVFTYKYKLFPYSHTNPL